MTTTLPSACARGGSPMRCAHRWALLAVLLPWAAWAESPRSADEAVQTVLDAAHAGPPKEDGAARLRREALREAAQVYGSQSGWAARWRVLENELMTRDEALCAVFRFNTFYLR